MDNSSALYDHFLKCLQGSGDLYCEIWYLSLAPITNIWIAHKIRFCTPHKGYHYTFWSNLTKYTISLGGYNSTCIKSRISRESWLDFCAFQERYCTWCISEEYCTAQHCIAARLIKKSSSVSVYTKRLVTRLSWIRLLCCEMLKLFWIYNPQSGLKHRMQVCAAFYIFLTVIILLQDSAKSGFCVLKCWNCFATIHFTSVTHSGVKHKMKCFIFLSP